MAGRRSNTLDKINTITQFLYGVMFFRFVFFLYSFLSFIFWFLNCFEVNWLYMFNWLFVYPYQLVNIFYKAEGVSADFTLAIIGGISLLLGFIMDFTKNILIQIRISLQEKAEREQRERKMRRKKIPRPMPVNNTSDLTAGNNPISAPNLNMPQENPKLLFIISCHVSKIKRKETDLELTFQEVEVWKQRVNKKLLENVNYSKPMQKGYYRKNLFLVYKDFNYVDDFIYYIKPTLESIILEFKKYGISIYFCHVLSSLSDIEMLEKELDCMDTILSLNFNNEIVVTNRFKITYDLKTTQQYSLVIKGEYNLSKNLTISNRQPLFSLKDKKGEQNK